MFDSGAEPEFTGILYGIVASNALFRLSYDLGLRNWMLLFAFFVLATDWAEYRVSVHSPPETVERYVLQFGLDILVLVVWTVLTIVPPVDVHVFLAVAGAFVLLQGVWDRLLNDSRLQGVRVLHNIEIAAFLVLLAVVGATYGIDGYVLLAVGVLGFLGWKGHAWRQIYADIRNREPSAVQ